MAKPARLVRASGAVAGAQAVDATPERVRAKPSLRPILAKSPSHEDSLRHVRAAKAQL